MDDERLPLLTVAETREVVELLLHFGEGDSEEAWAAEQLAHDLARRLPA